MKKENDPQNMKETFGLFLKQSDVNYTFTNLVCDNKDKALEYSKRISEDFGVTCVVVDERFTIVRECNA